MSVVVMLDIVDMITPGCLHPGRGRNTRLRLGRFIQRLSCKSFLMPLFLFLLTPICKLLGTKMRLRMNIGGDEKFLFFVFFRSPLQFDGSCSRKTVDRLRWYSVQKTKPLANEDQPLTTSPQIYGLTQIHILADPHHPSADLVSGRLHEGR